MPVHRSPPPLSAEVTPNCFIVRDANGQALSYLYYESETGRRSAAKLLNRDEAPRIAANIAKLPELLQGRLFTEYSQVNRRSFFCLHAWADFGNDNTHCPYLCRRRHDCAVTGLWLANLHDDKRGTRQVSQRDSLFAPTLLER